MNKNCETGIGLLKKVNEKFVRRKSEAKDILTNETVSPESVLLATHFISETSTWLGLA